MNSTHLPPTNTNRAADSPPSTAHVAHSSIESQTELLPRSLPPQKKWFFFLCLGGWSRPATLHHLQVARPTHLFLPRLHFHPWDPCTTWASPIVLPQVTRTPRKPAEGEPGWSGPTGEGDGPKEGPAGWSWMKHPAAGALSFSLGKEGKKKNVKNVDP